jgi:lactoylglutathione lyase
VTEENTCRLRISTTRATPDGKLAVPMKVVFSGADPRLEFIQAVPGTVWTPADSGVHHLGYWSDDVETDLKALEASGMVAEVTSYNPDGSGTMLWAYAKGSTGPRIEMVSRAIEPGIAYWWSTTDADPTPTA